VKQTNWVRRFEHTVLRCASFVFSLVSAHAILWFFSALNHVDSLQPFVTWGIALGFGVLGYFVSRGLAHRLLNHERVRVYIFICLVFELVEVVCNYAMAAVAVQWITWLGLVPSVQRAVLTFLTYVVLSIIPVVTVMLAWVDMDLERAKQGYEVRGFGGYQPGAVVPSYVPPGGPLPGYGGVRPPAQPKASPAPITSTPGMTAPAASYQQGYTGAGAMPAMLPNRAAAGVPTMAFSQGSGAPAVAPGMVASLPAMASGASEPSAGGWWNRMASALPFGGRPAVQPPGRE